ncbi:hypothetical protein [Arthrobacter rhombi]|uniref:hypothetical protein n=1 Tax=Arthrobacter rhombi TaxID=71253 RepID=UPI003FCF5A96
MDTFYWYNLTNTYALAESKGIPLDRVGLSIQGRRAAALLADGAEPVGTIEAMTGRGDDRYPKLRFPNGTWARLDLTIKMAIENEEGDLWAQLVTDSLTICPGQTIKELSHNAKIGIGTTMGALGRLQRDGKAELDEQNCSRILA